MNTVMRNYKNLGKKISKRVLNLIVKQKSTFLSKIAIKKITL